MPRSGPNGTYTLPGAQATQQPNNPIPSAVNNTGWTDVEQTFNSIQPIPYGGTGVNDGKPLDNTFGVKNVLDLTKVGTFNAAGIPTGTTRTYDLPYYSGTLGLVSDIRGQIFGLTLSNNVTDATNDIDIAAGAAVDTTGTASMLLASSLTKRLDAAWAVGTGNGGLDTGAVGNNTYYGYLIMRPDTGVVDAIFSLSSTAPTLPANYTLFAPLGQFARINGINSAPRSYSQKEATNWVQYTPVFTGFGTPTGVSMWSRRVGDTLHVRGRFTSGTPTAVEGRMTFGFNGVSGNVTSSPTKVSATQIAGPMIVNLTSAISAYTLIESNVGSLAFSYQASGESAFTKKNGDGFGSGTAMSFMAEIPIAGW